LKKTELIQSNRDQNHETHAHHRSPGAAGFRFRGLRGCAGGHGARCMRVLRRNRGLHLLLIA
jgi:hypothetical protein